MKSTQVGYRYDVVIVDRAKKEVILIIGRDLSRSQAERCEETGVDKVGATSFVTIVPRGRFKEGDEYRSRHT